MGSTRHKVVATRGWIDVPVDRILPAAWNYKGEDDRLSAALRANLRKNGQVESVIVRVHPTAKGFYEMVNGNHRLPEFKEAGITTVHCYNLGKVSQAAAARVAIETNDTRFQNDPVKLAGLLNDLHSTFTAEDLHATLPFTGGELDNYAALLKFDWAQFDVNAQAPHVPKPQVLSFHATPEMMDLWEQLSQRAASKGAGEPEAVLLSIMRYAAGSSWPE